MASAHLRPSAWPQALAIVEYGDAPVPTTPQLSITNDELTSAILVPLTPPSQFPPTYGDADDASIDDGAPYSTTAWSALLDGALIKQGLQIAIVMDEAGGAVRYNLTGYVGCPSRFKMVSLPFYWYGANERTTEYVPLTAEVTGTMPQTHVVSEARAT